MFTHKQNRYTLWALSVVLALGLPAQTPAAPEAYRIDPGHSSVGFQIRHLLEPGQFTRFAGTIAFDRENMTLGPVEATIQVASIETYHAGRKKNLLGDNFFNASAHPEIAFRSTGCKRTGEDSFDVTGELTMKGTSREIVLKAQLMGLIPDPDGSVLSGWEATGKLNRNDFAVTGPQNLIASGTLGGEVTINLSSEARFRPIPTE